MATVATWMGAIPENWGSCPLKHIFEIQKRIAGKEGYTVLSITQSGIKPKNMSSKGQYAQDYTNYQLVHPGDFAMNHMDLLTGWVDISRYEGVTSPDYRVFVNRDASRFCSEYYKFIFQYCYSNKIFYGMGQGVSGFGRWRLPAEMFLNFRLPVPGLEEQLKIASFLDQKICDIDAVITEARASIEEYKAWKASIIYEAVTKGLDPNAEMKVSGIEWIETIPAGIHISRVGLHFDVILGKMLCPLQIDDRYSLESYFCAANVHFTGVDTQDLKQMWFSPEEKERYLVKQGDLLVVEGGAGAGGCAVYNHETENIYVQNSIMIVRGKENSDNRYLKYWLESLVRRGYIDFVCNKATIPHFTKEKLSNVPFPVFTLNEQQNVADYLDNRCAQIDSLIAEKDTLISDLEAYKKSLIFEVVTGKRKVV